MIRNVFKALFVAWALMNATQVSASMMTFNFSMHGFSNGGTITGSFTGQDLNNDGYISSFPFMQPIDFLTNPFQSGMNEVSSATATFNGVFDGGEFGGGFGTVNSFTVSHDLTDLSDEVFPGFPFDIFFLLNFDLNNGEFIGDGPYEGILLGTSDQDFVFGAGRFLPAPAGITFTDVINVLPGGATLTSKLIQNDALGAPCAAGATCGAVHTVYLDANFMPTLGGYDLSSGLVKVSKVTGPASIPLFIGSLAALVIIRLKRQACF